MAIGDKKKIRLEMWSSAKNASGSNIESVFKYNLWADVKTASSSKERTNGLTSMNDTKIFEVDWKPDIFPTGNMKIAYSGRLFSVSGIENVDEKRFKWRFTATSIDKK